MGLMFNYSSITFTAEISTVNLGKKITLLGDYAQIPTNFIPIFTGFTS